MKYLFKEQNNIEKSKKVISKYIELVNLNNNRSSEILMLVPNNTIRIKYQRDINIDFSEDININTYVAFVKNELIKYWPIVIENCEKIHKNTIAPIFISNSLSEYIITDLVSKKREFEGYFEELTGTNRNIANSIKNNINMAAFNLIDFDYISEKIYLSKKNKDRINRYPYSEMNEIINSYIDTLFSNSMIDNALSVYLYNKYLMKNEIYLSKLQSKIKYLIVDSLENLSPSELEFFNLISSSCKDTYAYFNSSRDFSSFNNVDMEYIKRNVIENFDIYNNLNLNREEIKGVNLEDIYCKIPKIYFNQNSQLYSEMIEQLCEDIITLVSNGEFPKNICVITPVNNTILDYEVKAILKNRGIDTFNTRKDKKLVDYTYANTIVTATCIFYEYFDLISEEDYVSFIQIMLNINRIKALSIYRKKEENKDYIKILKYIEEKRKLNIKINEFMMQFYIDKILNLKYGKFNVKICKQIINESEMFTENITLLGLDNKKHKEKIFIEALKTIINDFYNASEMEEIRGFDGVIITTPYSYISSNMSRPIHIWVDIGSNAWNLKIEKDISNPIVLKNSFEDKKSYTDLIEESYKKYYLYNMIYNLLEGTRKIYAYKSEYSVNGYIQDSILNGLLLKLLDKGDNLYGKDKL